MDTVRRADLAKLLLSAPALQKEQLQSLEINPGDCLKAEHEAAKQVPYPRFARKARGSSCKQLALGARRGHRSNSKEIPVGTFRRGIEILMQSDIQPAPQGLREIEGERTETEQEKAQVTLNAAPRDGERLFSVQRRPKPRWKQQPNVLASSGGTSAENLLTCRLKVKFT